MNFTLENFLNGVEGKVSKERKASVTVEKAVEVTKKSAKVLGRTMKHITPASIAYVERVEQESLDRDLELHVRLTVAEKLLGIPEMPEEELVAEIERIKEAMEEIEANEKKAKKEESQAAREAKRNARKAAKVSQEAKDIEEKTLEIMQMILESAEAPEATKEVVKEEETNSPKEEEAPQVEETEALENGVFDDPSESRYDYAKMSK